MWKFAYAPTCILKFPHVILYWPSLKMHWPSKFKNFLPCFLLAQSTDGFRSFINISRSRFNKLLCGGEIAWHIVKSFFPYALFGSFNILLELKTCFNNFQVVDELSSLLVFMLMVKFGFIVTFNFCIHVHISTVAVKQFLLETQYITLHVDKIIFPDVLYCSPFVTISLEIVSTPSVRY